MGQRLEILPQNQYYTFVKTLLTMTILVLTIPIFIACEKQDSVEEEALYENLPVQELDSTSLSFTVNGKNNAILHAQTIYKFTDSRLTKARDIQVEFTGNNQEDSGILYADSGSFEESKSLIHVYGHVQLITEEGGKLLTNSLTWNTRGNTVYTDDYVVIEKDGERIEGHGLETDVGFDKIIIKEEVEANLEGGLLE